MGSERVDKRWVELGLEAFSAEAILGTLGHYGVALTEAEVRELVHRHYPLGLAQLWAPAWKGTGKFLHFPLAAARALFARFNPEALTPPQVAVPLLRLVEALRGAARGEADDATLETRFAVVESLAQRVVAQTGSRQELADELEAALRGDGEGPERLGERLIEAKRLELAARWGAIEGDLFPERLGLTHARLQIASGDRPGGVAALVALATAENQSRAARVNAVSTLLEVGARAEAQAAFGKLPVALTRHGR